MSWCTMDFSQPYFLCAIINELGVGSTTNSPYLRQTLGVTALSSHCFEESSTNSTPTHLSWWLRAGKMLGGWRNIKRTSQITAALFLRRLVKNTSALVTKTQEAGWLTWLHSVWPFAQSFHVDCWEAWVNGCFLVFSFFSELWLLFSSLSS